MFDSEAKQDQVHRGLCVIAIVVRQDVFSRFIQFHFIRNFHVWTIVNSIKRKNVTEEQTSVFIKSLDFSVFVRVQVAAKTVKLLT